MSAPAQGPSHPGDLGDLDWLPALARPDLLAPPVAGALGAWPAADRVLVAAIEESVADTAELVRAHGVPLEACGNCVVVTGRRGEVARTAACVVRASTRADVNGLVRRALDARKASFAPREDAVASSGMEFGGITPVGLPADWLLLVDAAVAALPVVVVGSGLRRSKLALPGEALAQLPGAQVVDGLGIP